MVVTYKEVLSLVSESGPVNYFVNHQFKNLHVYTINVAGSWMMVDLGANRYSLRHDSNDAGYLRNWVLEGKMDHSDTSVERA